MKKFRNILRTAVIVFAGVLFAASLMAQPHEVGLERAAAVKAARVGQLLGNQGVVGVGVGLDEAGNGAVHILVLDAAAAARMPRVMDGVPVVVEVSGEIFALGALEGLALERPTARPGGGTRVDPTAVFPRPVPIGVSTGNGELGRLCAAGTIGCRVRDSSGKVYALSNNHVYALENSAVIGDDVTQPGPYDTRCQVSSAYYLGTLAAFVPLNFEAGKANVVDAAIAETTGALMGRATPANGYGTPSSTTTAAEVGQAVQKYGRTTALTRGTVTAIQMSVAVGYSSGTARFDDQILVYSRKAFIKAGDSGSLLVTHPDKEPVGLLFAGDATGRYAFANPIGPVLDAFHVTIDGE